MSHSKTQFALPYYEMEYQCLNKVYTQKNSNNVGELREFIILA
jgi:hypothetical protein